jgi:4-amino-4-deoxy-L-arabinose transferase-like glycosyltransferase
VLVCAGLALGYVLFSLTAAPPWNEGIHLLAAQLILAGKRPYLDFFYQHPPLYPYLNAGWMSVFGDSWRSAGALAALLTAAAIGQVARIAATRVPDQKEARAGAVLAALLVGLHALVIRFGAVGQAWGLALLATLLAFRCTVAAVARPGLAPPAAAGFCAGAAANSWMLASPALAVLPCWLARHNRAGSAGAKCTAFAAGAMVAFLPLLGLAALSPRPVWFDVFAYHLFHRRPEGSTGGFLVHDLRVLAGVLNSPQALVLLLLAGIGLLWLGRAEWPAAVQAEFRLCAWLAAAFAALAACASPTFSGYFVLAVPSLAILAAVGAVAVVSLLGPGGRRTAWLGLVMAVYAVGGAKWWFQNRGMFQQGWQAHEAAARAVNRVTPPQAPVFALPEVYFVARRLPPPGLENPFASYLPEGVAASRGVVPRSEIERWLAAGRFATVLLDNSTQVERLGLQRVYSYHENVSGFELLWGSVARPDPRP